MAPRLSVIGVVDALAVHRYGIPVEWNMIELSYQNNVDGAVDTSDCCEIGTLMDVK